MIRRTLTICPGRSGGSGAEPTVATVSRVKRKPCQSETSSVSEYAIAPATWIATISRARTASRRRNGSNSPRSRPAGPSKLLKRLRRACRPRAGLSPPEPSLSGSAGRLRDRRISGPRVVRTEDGGACDEQPRTRLRDAAGGRWIDAAVDLDRAGTYDLAHPADLVGRVGDEGLSSPAGVDGHAEKDVGVVDGLADGRYRCAGIDRQPRHAAELADRVERAVDVRRGLGVEGDVVRTGLGELLDVIAGPLDHQVDVDGAARVVDQVGDRSRHQWADRDRRDEVAIHHVDVDDPRAGRHHLLDLRAEAREVGGENRGRDALRGEKTAP